MDALLDQLKNLNLVSEGAVSLKGGSSSHFYIDIKKAYGHPEVFRNIVNEVAKRISKEATCIAGSGNGGIPLATAVSLKLGKKLSIVRDAEKSHGLNKVVDGHVPSSKDKVMIVDDVFTSGTSIKSTASQMPPDIQVVGAVVVVLREEPLDLPFPIKNLFTAEDILTF